MYSNKRPVNLTAKKFLHSVFTACMHVCHTPFPSDGNVTSFLAGSKQTAPGITAKLSTSNTTSLCHWWIFIPVHASIPSQQGKTEEIVCCRGHPRSHSLLDKLNGIETLGASASCLQDQVTILQTVSNFPLLMYVNEPMHHLTCSEVCTATQYLQDTIHWQCNVPKSVFLWYQMWTVYESLASDDGQKPWLSGPTPYSTVSPNDGNGLMMSADWNFLYGQCTHNWMQLMLQSWVQLILWRQMTWNMGQGVQSCVKSF